MGSNARPLQTLSRSDAIDLQLCMVWGMSRPPGFVPVARHAHGLGTAIAAMLAHPIWTVRAAVLPVDTAGGTPAPDGAPGVVVWRPAVGVASALPQLPGQPVQTCVREHACRMFKAAYYTWQELTQRTAARVGMGVAAVERQPGTRFHLLSVPCFAALRSLFSRLLWQAPRAS